MRITKENISKLNFHGLALTLKTTGPIKNMGKLHKSDCSMVKVSKIVMMDSGVIEDTIDLLDRGYGVILCKCAKSHKDVQ